jgi:hypothetical protein
MRKRLLALLIMAPVTHRLLRAHLNSLTHEACVTTGGAIHYALMTS